LIRIRRYLLGTDTGDNRNSNLFLYNKVIISTVRAVVCFYVRCLIHNKAEISANNKRRGGKNLYFQNCKRALRRMFDDLQIIRKYLMVMSNEQLTLQRIVINELSVLELIYECLLCCHHEEYDSSTGTSLESFIVVIHKRCTNGNPMTTKYFIGDLYFLMTSSASSDGRFGQNHQLHQQRVISIQNALQQLQPDLQLVSSRMKEIQEECSHDGLSLGKKKSNRPGDMVISLHRLDSMLQTIYEDRMSQGIVPALCSSICIPHLHDEDDNDAKEIITELFYRPIRMFNRKFKR
jgi:hypothetical protein